MNRLFCLLRLQNLFGPSPSAPVASAGLIKKPVTSGRVVSSAEWPGSQGAGSSLTPPFIYKQQQRGLRFLAHRRYITTCHEQQWPILRNLFFFFLIKRRAPGVRLSQIVVCCFLLLFFFPFEGKQEITLEKKSQSATPSS